MATERVTFTGATGAELSGSLEMPSGPVRACALFAHCFTCSSDVFAAARIARGLAEHGIAVLRFDFTGLGRSDGDFAETTFSSNVDDLVAAAEFMRSRLEGPAILIGHSLGGAAVLQAATRIAESRAVCTIGAPADPEHVRLLLGEGQDEIRERGEATVDIGGRPFTVRREFLADLERQPGAAAAAELGRALLIFHSPTDTVVGIGNARALYEAARHPKSFVALDGADHLLTRRSDAEFVAAVLAAWAERYID